MRLSALILVPLCIWLASCGSTAQLAQPEVRTVTYAGSDWNTADIAVEVSPVTEGWRVAVSSTAEQPAGTLLLELRFDSALAARDAVATVPHSDLSLLAAGRPGGVGLGVVMPQGQSIQPGELLTFTLAPATRVASAGPGPGPSYVATLSGVPAAGEVDLDWDYALKGDYDQNSEVNVADISALGPRLGHSTSDGTDDAADAVVDGDGNGEVNISDLTTLGANFMLGVNGYNVYSATGDDLGTAVSTSAGANVFADSTKPGARVHFAYALTDPLRIADGYFYVRAKLNNSTEGDASNVVNIAGAADFQFEVPPAGQTTVDAALALAPSLALLNGDGTTVEDGAPLVAYVTGAGELHLAHFNDGAWETATVGGGTFALPQLYVEGGNWYVIAYDVLLQKIVRLGFDSTLTAQSNDDVAVGLTDAPVFLDVDVDATAGKTGVAYGYNVAGGGYGVQFADNPLGSFSLSPVALSVSDQLFGLTFKYDANGEEGLYFTHGTLDTSTTIEIASTLERSTFDGGTWSFPAAVAYPDSPLQLDLGFAVDGTTPKLAFTAARDTTFPIPGNPITVSLAFDGVVGTFDGGTWSFDKYFTSSVDLNLTGFPTTAGLDLAMDLENSWARTGELSYTLGNGGILFKLADLTPTSGGLDGAAHYAVDNGGTLADNAYFDGAAGLSQSWDEHTAVHGVAYLQFPTIDTAALLSGNFDQAGGVLFWRK